MEVKAKPTSKYKNITERKNKGYIMIPYGKGMCESIKNIRKKHGLQTYWKWGRNLGTLLVTPKDKDAILQMSGVIYRFSFYSVDCHHEYVGECTKTFGERFNEHLKAPFSIHGHELITDHQKH